MVFGQGVEQFAVGQYGPSVGTCPMEGGLLRQSFHVAVTVKPLSGTNMRSMNCRLTLAASLKYLVDSSFL